MAEAIIIENATTISQKIRLLWVAGRIIGLWVESLPELNLYADDLKN